MHKAGRQFASLYNSLHEICALDKHSIQPHSFIILVSSDSSDYYLIYL